MYQQGREDMFKEIREEMRSHGASIIHYKGQIAINLNNFAVDKALRALKNKDHD